MSALISRRRCLPATPVSHFPELKVALLLLTLICSEANADINDGLASYNRGDYAAAFTEFSVAATQDDDLALNLLGTMYVRALGVERNYKLALDNFYKAQALGSIEATANLGKMYEDGLGVPQNNTLALQFYRDAARAGLQPVIVRMAEIYERGELGVVPDAAAARDWRAKLPAAQAASGDEHSAKGKAIPKRSAAQAMLPTPTRQDTATRTDVDQGALFEKQVLSALERYAQRERKLFVASTDRQPALASYLDELRVRLKAHLVTASAAATTGKRMIVSLSILRNGVLRDVELSRPSGDPRADRMVLSSLKKISHLQPLPGEIVGDVDVLVVSMRLPLE